MQALLALESSCVPSPTHYVPFRAIQAAAGASSPQAQLPPPLPSRSPLKLARRQAGLEIEGQGVKKETEEDTRPEFDERRYGDGGTGAGRGKDLALVWKKQPRRYQNLYPSPLLSGAHAHTHSQGTSECGDDDIVKGNIWDAGTPEDDDECVQVQHVDGRSDAHEPDDLYDVGIDVTHRHPFEVTATHGIMDSHHQLQGYPGYKNALVCKGDHVLSVQGCDTQTLSFEQLSQILCGKMHSECCLVIGRWDDSCDGYAPRFTVSILRHRPQMLALGPAASHSPARGGAGRHENGRDGAQKVDAKHTWTQILEARMSEGSPVLHVSPGVGARSLTEDSRLGSGGDGVGGDSTLPSVDSSGQSLQWSMQGIGPEDKRAALRERSMEEIRQRGREEGAKRRQMKAEAARRALKMEGYLEASASASFFETGSASPSGETTKAENGFTNLSEINWGKMGEKEAEKGGEGVRAAPQVFAQQADKLDRLSLVVCSKRGSSGRETRNSIQRLQTFSNPAL